MSLHLANLSHEIRDLMLSEVQHDIEANALYYSKRFSQEGREVYPKLLIEAIKGGDDCSLAQALDISSCFEASSMQTRKGKLVEVRTPVNASSVFAEGEFNRFYCRALCQKVIADGKGDLVVYRAKAVQTPRLESERKIGSRVDPFMLLQDLRANIGVDTALGLPGGPNSGLSIRLT